MNVNITNVTRIGLNLLALLGAIVALRLGESVFIPLVFALLLATILWSSANRLHEYYKLPWALACLMSVTVLVLFNLILTLWFIFAIPKMIQDLAPKDYDRQKQIYQHFRHNLASISPVPLDERYFPEDPSQSELFSVVQQTLSGPYVAEALLKTVGYLTNWLWQFVLIMFILLFLLMEGRMLTRRFTEIFGPSTEVRSKVAETLQEMTHSVRTYLVWRTIINIALGVAVASIYNAMGLRQAWTWGLLTAVLCYIPYLGPIIAGLPPILDAFIFVSPLMALAVLVFYSAVITLEGYVIVPLVMGRHMDLNATTVMLACLFWDLVWGVPGLFLAMPLMAGFKAICDHVPGGKPWANLMSATGVDTGPPEAPPANLPPTVDLEQTMLMEEPLQEVTQRSATPSPASAPPARPRPAGAHHRPSPARSISRPSSPGRAARTPRPA
jgi:predicted PurR-regulated permease PerM